MKNKIHTSFKALLLIYLPLYVIGSIIFYLIAGLNFPPLLRHYISLIIWTGLTVFYLVIAYRSAYYEISKHAIIHHKGKNTLYYNYKDIIYIDEAYSEKKLSIRFITRVGDERYLTHDPKRLVYKAMVERVGPYMSKEEINRQFPKIHL